MDRHRTLPATRPDAGWPGWLAALALGAAALMQPLGAGAQPAPTAEHDRLATHVALKGRVRVIVGLDVAAAPEGTLSRPAALSQRAAIRTAQNAAAAELLAGTAGRVRAVFDTLPHFAAEVDGAALARMRSSRSVKFLQEDRAVRPSLLQSAPLIGADTAWAAGRTGSGWAVAVLDTGVDKTHPFLSGKVVSEACYSSDTTESNSVCPGGVASSTAAGSGVNCNTSISGCTHGTHVAGIVAGTGAADGSHGVAKGASIIAIQVFSHFPAEGAVMSYTSDQIKGLERVLALKDTYQIAAVNMSLGGGQYSATCDGSEPAIKAAIDNLRSVGIATVIATGNDGFRTSVSAPACVSSAISVGSVCDSGPDGGACATGTGGVASYSNIASFISLVAPGSIISSSVPGGGYAAQHGTSMATPQVAGAWALVKQAQPSISVADALSLLRTNGTAVNDTRSGGSVAGLRSLHVGFLTGNAYTLALSKSGTGTGNVTSAPSGVSCGADCTEPYAEGTSVSLTATPTGGSTFGGWGGDCSGSGACTLTMSAARSVSATFTAAVVTPSYAVGVTKAGEGTGTVTSTPSGISCGITCTKTLASGSALSLKATPASGSVFAGWSGDGCSGSATTCALTVGGATNVVATFAKAPQTLGAKRAGTGSGVVTSSTGGIDCGAVCSASLAYNTAVTLTATPAEGSTFTGWTGACTGTGTCALTMSKAQSAVATFTRITHALTLAKAGGGTGTVTSSPSGIGCGTACTKVFNSGTDVVLTAKPAVGTAFAGWGGACSGSAATCTVTMSQARDVTATFSISHHLLTVTRSGTSKGGVKSDEGSIDCGSKCKPLVAVGTTLTLTATPVAETAFAGWTGDCSGTGSCVLTMNAPRSVGAVFDRSHYTLTTATAGAGKGSIVNVAQSIDCSGSCKKSVPIDSAVTLTPVPVENSAFTGWTGACTGTGACTVTMSKAQTVTATFGRITHLLTVTKDGNGSGTVASAPSGIGCGTSCSKAFFQATDVVLTAKPALANAFTGWGGACSGSATTCTVTMSQARDVTATFTIAQHLLTVTKNGSSQGSVSSDDGSLACGSKCKPLLAVGATVTLTATPVAETAFAGWGGDCSGTGSCVLTMGSPHSVSATFNRSHYTLTTLTAGAGKGSVGAAAQSIDCTGSCKTSIAIGTDVTLSPVPHDGSTFSHWTGACTGTGGCTVTMSKAQSVTANFVRIVHALAVARDGAGSVTSSPSGLNCGTTCSKTFFLDTVVTLTAKPAAGSTFGGWTGACSGSAPTCAVTMSEAQSVGATFGAP